MKRFNLNDKATLIEKPNTTGRWGVDPGYEPYERVRAEGRTWQLIQYSDNSDISFFIENKFTGARLKEIQDESGLAAYKKAVEQFQYAESLPAGTMPQIQAAQTDPVKDPIYTPPTKSKQQIEMEESLAKLTEENKQLEAKRQARLNEIEAELLRQKIEAAKETLLGLEEQFLKAHPEPFKTFVPDGDGGGGDE